MKTAFTLDDLDVEGRRILVTNYDAEDGWKKVMTALLQISSELSNVATFNRPCNLEGGQDVLL